MFDDCHFLLILQTKIQASAVKKSKKIVDNWKKKLIESAVPDPSYLVKSDSNVKEMKSESKNEENLATTPETGVDNSEKAENSEDAENSEGEDTENCEQELSDQEEITQTFDAQIIKESMIDLVAMVSKD